jgi:hypothetical protein
MLFGFCRETREFLVLDLDLDLGVDAYMYKRTQSEPRA